jgi:hypothetical protein
MRFMLSSLLLVILVPCLLFAQEDTTSSRLEFMPGITFVRLFPGAPLEVPGSENIEEPAYAGNGLKFTVRCFPPALSYVAITFGGGVTWFYDSQTSHGITAPMEAGTGAQLWREGFTVFPLSLGAQVIYPFRGKEKLMFFAGAEGNLNLIDGRVMPGQQTKVGYTLLGGFVVSVFEFGVRYSVFSDLKNLGVHIGLRFASFTF